MENQHKRIEILKIQNELKKKGRISECFYHKKEECKGKIKLAHSIQRNGRLSILAEKINGNDQIYSFIEFDFDENMKPKLSPVGKGEASTFFGFCDFHDTFLFKEIENNRFIDNDKHCFLHSYRAFAHTHHRKLEQLKAFAADTEFARRKNLQKSTIATEIGIKEGEAVRRKFENILNTKNYSKLEYSTVMFNNLFLVACSSSFTPTFSPKSNRMLNYHADTSIPFEKVFITVLPDEHGNRTILILACFPDDKKSVLFIDEFDDLPILYKKKILTSILIGEVENTFISPSLFNALGKIGQEVLVKELQQTTIFSNRVVTTLHKSRLNFFEEKYSAFNLRKTPNERSVKKSMKKLTNLSSKENSKLISTTKR